MSELTVVVVDDHPMLRSGVSETLSAEEDIEVIGEKTAEGGSIVIGGGRGEGPLAALAAPRGGLVVVRAPVAAHSVLAVLRRRHREDDAVGAVTSSTVIVWVTRIWLSQSSVTL